MLTRRITPAFALGTPALAFFQPCSRWCKNEMHCAVLLMSSWKRALSSPKWPNTNGWTSRKIFEKRSDI